MNASEVPGFQTGAETHVGAVRRHNEDAFAVREDLGLWIVADGMGGAAAGDVASAVAVAEIEARVGAGAGLVGAMRAAHEAILAAPGGGRGTAGMGSTAVALEIRSDAWEVAWVGDSRAYLWRDGALRRLTRDHSLVQELVDRGELTEPEARRHPQRNIITRVLGGLGIARPLPDQISGDLRTGDVFLLCTDGLNGELHDAEIKAVLDEAGGPGDAAQRLVAAALAAGGRDNITAVVVAGR